MTKKLIMDKSLFQTDWRLKDRPWDYIHNAKLSYVRTYRPYRKNWDHEHCAFCFTSIGTNPDEKHSGYCTTDREPNRQEWFCETCYRDFAALFSWTVKEYPELSGKKLSRQVFSPEKTGQEFTQCVLCLTRIAPDDGSTNEAYHLPGTDVWVCPDCHREHGHRYGWA